MTIPMFRLLKRKWFWLLVIVLAVVVGRSLSRGPSVASGSYLLVELEGKYREGPPGSLLGKLLEEHGSYVELIDSLRKATIDPRLAGIVLRVGTLEIGWAQAREIREMLRGARAAGKRIVAYLDNELAGANLSYYVASTADMVYLPPGASAMLTGLSAHFVFLGGVWEKIDVAMQVEQIREYKTFGDTITRKQMSPAHREMANWLLDDLNDEFVGAIAEGRKVTVPEVLSTIDACPSAAQEYVDASLADRVAYFDEMLREIGGGRPATVVPEKKYRRVPAKSVGLGGAEKVAVIHAVGTIVSGDSPRSGAVGSAVGSRTLERAFRQALDDASVKAIVLRIDSPGGSAAASDQVWRAAKVARERKPVIVSMGNVAASGGYYMGAAADKIVAEPGTLTGSIGVILMKPDMSGLLARLGVSTDALGRGRYSRVMDLTKSMDKAELALVKGQMNGVYRRFLERVAEGRKMTVEAVDAVGGGRVWTGRQAKERGLVDELGGLATAVRLAAEQGGMPAPDKASILHLPRPQNRLQELLAGYAAQATLAVPATWRATLERSFGTYVNLDAGVHTLAAEVIEIR
jgi:protease-4